MDKTTALPEVIKTVADGADRCRCCEAPLHAGNPCWMSDRGVYCSHACFVCLEDETTWAHTEEN
jgi:hypothetical protein